MKHSPSLLFLFLFLSLSSLLLLLSPPSKATTVTNYNHFDDFAGGDTDLPFDQPPPLSPPVPDTAESPPPSDDGGDDNTTQLPPPTPPSEQIEYTPPFSAPSSTDLPPSPPSPFGVLPPTIGGGGSGNALPFGQPMSAGFGQQQQHPLSGFGQGQQQQQQQQQQQGLNGGSLPLVDNTPYDSGCERREGAVEYLVMMLYMFVCGVVIFMMQ